MLDLNFKVKQLKSNLQTKCEDLSPGKSKKQFNLADLKKKAELRLIQIKK